MGRPLRIECPGAFYHVTSRGNVPAVGKHTDRPTIEAIRAASEQCLVEDPRRARRVALYLCHRLTGLRLREIGAAFGMAEAAISQASRRVEDERVRSTELASVIDEVRAQLGMLNVEI